METSPCECASSLTRISARIPCGNGSAFRAQEVRPVSHRIAQDRGTQTSVHSHLGSRGRGLCGCFHQGASEGTQPNDIRETTCSCWRRKKREEAYGQLPHAQVLGGYGRGRLKVGARVCAHQRGSHGVRAHSGTEAVLARQGMVIRPGDRSHSRCVQVAHVEDIFALPETKLPRRREDLQRGYEEDGTAGETQGPHRLQLAELHFEKSQ